MKNLENGKYLNTVENDETVQIGYSIILKLFSESSNHEWWFDGHTWPDDTLSKIYNESKKDDLVLPTTRLIMPNLICFGIDIKMYNKKVSPFR